jgi:hypothetical protein
VALARLPGLLRLSAGRARGADNPVGAGCIERCVAPLGPLQPMWAQRRHLDASEPGRVERWLCAVSYRDLWPLLLATAALIEREEVVSLTQRAIVRSAAYIVLSLVSWAVFLAPIIWGPGACASDIVPPFFDIAP